MAKSKRGRKAIKEADKVVSAGVYLKKSEKIRVEKKFGSLTKAIRVAALSQC